jgi:hypothetical protein
MVLREDRLAEGLAYLAAEVGHEAPRFTPAAPNKALAGIYDTDLEDAARDAYTRDYIAFGFRDWRA